MNFCFVLFLSFASVIVTAQSDINLQEKGDELPIFNDGFESGTTLSWDITEPNQFPNCNCYFSGDCTAALFCNWGPSGPFTEDICNWRQPKPNGIPGTGCDEDAQSAGPICDGYCSPSSRGSQFGLEDTELLQSGIRLWAAAILEPARHGGGPVDPELAAAARSLPYFLAPAADILGRHVADTIAFTIDHLFREYFCHFEHHPLDPGPIIDLSNEPCRLQAAELVIDTLVYEMGLSGSGQHFMIQITQICPDWANMFSGACEPGNQVIDCAYKKIADLARLLTTAPEPL